MWRDWLLYQTACVELIILIRISFLYTGLVQSGKDMGEGAATTGQSEHRAGAGRQQIGLVEKASDRGGRSAGVRGRERALVLRDVGQDGRQRERRLPGDRQKVAEE